MVVLTGGGGRACRAEGGVGGRQPVDIFNVLVVACSFATSDMRYRQSSATESELSEKVWERRKREGKRARPGGRSRFILLAIMREQAHGE